MRCVVCKDNYDTFKCVQCNRIFCVGEHSCGGNKTDRFGCTSVDNICMYCKNNTEFCIHCGAIFDKGYFCPEKCYQ